MVVVPRSTAAETARARGVSAAVRAGTTATGATGRTVTAEAGRSRHASRTEGGADARAAASAGDGGGTSPATTRTAQSPHVPAPPHVAARGTPARRAASSTVVPDGTATVTPAGTNVTSTVADIRQSSGTNATPKPVPVWVAITVPVSATCISATPKRSSIALLSQAALSGAIACITQKAPRS